MGPLHAMAPRCGFCEQGLCSSVLALADALTEHANAVVDAFSRAQTRRVAAVARAARTAVVEVVAAVGAAAELHGRRAEHLRGDIAEVRVLRARACECGCGGACLDSPRGPAHGGCRRKQSW